MFFRLYNHLIFSICCQPSTPTLQEHNLLIPKVFLNWKGFWLHHCSFQTCAKYPESLRLHFLCNTTIFTTPTDPLFFSPSADTIDLQLHHGCFPLRLCGAWLSHSRVPAKGREVDEASDSDPQSKPPPHFREEEVINLADSSSSIRPFTGSEVGGSQHNNG